VRCHARDFAADVILIEKSGIGLALLQHFETSRPSGMVSPIGIVPQGDKKDRLAAQSAKIEAGCLFVPTGAPFVPDFLTELLGFPKSLFATLAIFGCSRRCPKPNRFCLAWYSSSKSLFFPVTGGKYPVHRPNCIASFA
jgi:hypothetical protein